MSSQHYDIEVGDEARRVFLADTKRAAGDEPEFVSPLPTRSPARIALDCLMLLLLFLIVPAYHQSQQAFIVTAALAASVLLGGYAKVVWRFLDWLGPPDQPRVVSVIRIPPDFHCPSCGGHHVEGPYCARCGANMERAYRQLIREVSAYMVQETDGSCQSIQTSIHERVERAVEAQREIHQARIARIERTYIDEIIRQRQLIISLEARLAQQRVMATLPRPLLLSELSTQFTD